MEDSDEQIREDLLQKLVDARLMGPTSQIVAQCRACEASDAGSWSWILCNFVPPLPGI